MHSATRLLGSRSHAFFYLRPNRLQVKSLETGLDSPQFANIVRLGITVCVGGSLPGARQAVNAVAHPWEDYSVLLWATSALESDRE